MTRISIPNRLQNDLAAPGQTVLAQPIRGEVTCLALQHSHFPFAR